MTIIATESARASTVESSVTWSEVEEGFWVGNDSGEFLGTIESRGGGFSAYDSTRHHLGEFAGIERAQAEIIARH